MADQPITVPPVPRYYEVAPRRYWPVATLILLLVNFLVFGLEILLGGTKNLQVLLDLGAAYGPYMRRGEYWRLVMPIFLHGGWLHILGNSYALYILGPILERVYGYGRYATIYLAAGVGGAFLSMELSRVPSVGASGAIFGIAGAMLITGYAHREAIPRRWGRAFGRGIIPFIVLVLLSGYLEHGIDNWGHVGGLATGAMLAWIIPPPSLVSPMAEVAEPPSQTIVVLPLAVVILAMAATADHYRTLRAMDRLLAQGAHYESVHQFDDEYRCFREAAKLAPRVEEPHEELGRYYLEQKQYDQAMQEFQAAVRLTEGNDQARLEVALTYQLKGDLQKAQPIFEAVLGKNPRNTEGRRLLASNYVLLGDIYGQQKLYNDAITNYQAALRLEPQMAVAQNNLAWLYATCDDPKYRNPHAALNHAQIAVGLTNWEQGDFIDTLAEAHFANGDYQQAVEIQKKALALEPENKELQDHMTRYLRAASPTSRI